MGSARRTTETLDDSEEWQTVIPAPGNPQLIVAPEPEPETALDRVSRLLSEVSDDQRASVRLYRVKDGNAHKLEWCANYTVSEFEAGDLAMIRRDWGPGDYQIRVYGINPATGQFGIRAKDELSIAVDRNAPPPVHASQSPQLDGALKMMAEGQQKILEALMNRPDPMQGMAQTLALVAQMRDAFGLSGAGAQAGAKSQLAEIVGAIRELREVSAEINPPPSAPDESGGLLPMAGQLMDLIKTSMANRQPENVATSVPIIATPATLQAFPPVVSSPVAIESAESAPMNQAQPAEPSEADAIALLRGQLVKLVTMASVGLSPETGADFIYEQIPDEAIELMGLPNWFELLCQFEPSCKPVEKWMREAHAQAMQLLKDDETAGDESGDEKPTPAAGLSSPP